MSHLTITLGESEYEVRHNQGRIVGGTRLDNGRHVEARELIALATRIGRAVELVDALTESCLEAAS